MDDDHHAASPPIPPCVVEYLRNAKQMNDLKDAQKKTLARQKELQTDVSAWLRTQAKKELDLDLTPEEKEVFGESGKLKFRFVKKADYINKHSLAIHIEHHFEKSFPEYADQARAWVKEAVAYAYKKRNVQIGLEVHRTFKKKT